MPVFHWNVEDKISLRDSLYSLDAYVSHLIYEREFQPGDFTCAGATLTVLNSKIIALKFNSTTDTYAYVNFRHPDYWVDGELHITLYYSGDNTSGGIVVEGAVTPVGMDEVITSASQISVSETAGAPSNANELESVLIQPFTVDADDNIIGIRVGRLGTNGSDTNAGNLYVTNVFVKYYPERI